MPEIGISLHDALMRAADRFGGAHEAVCDANGELTLDDLIARARALAGAMRELGLSVGARVLVCAANRAEFVVAHFAILFAGGVSVPVDHFVSSKTFSYIAQVSGADMLVIAASTLETLRKDVAKLSLVVLVFGGETYSDGQVHAVDTLIKAGYIATLQHHGDLAAILFTTGSTGRPKGVMLSHAATLTALHNIIKFVGYTRADREVITVPVTHSFGLGHVYCNLFSGGAVYLENGLANVRRVLTAIRNWGATGFPSTPLGVGLLLDTYGTVFTQMAASLRFMVVNSARLNPERAAQLQAALPNTELFVYYGLTEASRSTFISLTREGPSKYESVGRPMPDVGIKIDANTQEVILSGPHLARGYWGDDDLTNAAFQSDGLRTGDRGLLDADGFLHLTGRLSDQINLGGYKIDPAEIENWVRAMPEIADAAVIGFAKSGKVEGDEIACALVMQPGHSLDAKALERQARATLEPYKIPSLWVELNALPRSATGKLLREELRRLVSEAQRTSTIRDSAE